MNDVLKAIEKRYSCRDFKSQPIPAGTLQAIARAGTQAPSAMNLQPWRVIVVTDKTLLADMEAEGMAVLRAQADRTMYDRIMGRGGRLFYGAPCMIVVPVDAARKDYPLIDCGIVCQTLALAAASLGVDSVICGLTAYVFAGARREAFRKRLGFPDGYEFGCSILLGYANSVKAPHEPDFSKISVIE